MAFQIIALLIMAAFYACYFLKMLEQYKKGIKTDQLGRGKSGLIQWIEITVKITAYLTPIAELISIALNTAPFPVAVRAIGAGIAALGVLVFALAVRTMQNNWRAGIAPDQATQLVTSGIYRISRNPAFLGFDLLYLGILIMYFNWVLFAVTILAVLALHLQIVNVEEDFLIQTFGKEYQAYMIKVCRYLGAKR